jgi:hypothetical protein
MAELDVEADADLTNKEVVAGMLRLGGAVFPETASLIAAFNVELFNDADLTRMVWCWEALF